MVRGKSELLVPDGVVLVWTHPTATIMNRKQKVTCGSDGINAVLDFLYSSSFCQSESFWAVGSLEPTCFKDRLESIIESRYLVSLSAVRIKACFVSQ